MMNQLSKLFIKKLMLDKLKTYLLQLQNNLDPKLPYFRQVVDTFNIKVKYSRSNVADIPTTGPVIFYANHPLSSSEIFAMSSVIECIRPDLKVVAAKYLESLHGFIDHAFFVEVFKTASSKKKQSKSNQEY